MYAPVNLTIKTWSEDDRPREKLRSKGRHNLSDAELLAIILGSGTPSESALDLSRRILLDAGKSLERLSRMEIDDLKKFRGIGEAKAIAVVAALELGRRRNAERPEEKAPVIRASADAYHIILPELGDLQHEEFWVMLLNRSNTVMRKVQISKGGMNSTSVDPKIVFKKAVQHGASALVLCHNHPSGSPKPSENDVRLTRRFRNGADLLDMTILDHIIVGANSYFSFADEGLV